MSVYERRRPACKHFALRLPDTDLAETAAENVQRRAPLY
jgi:hypothetical protein